MQHTSAPYVKVPQEKRIISSQCNLAIRSLIAGLPLPHNRHSTTSYYHSHLRYLNHRRPALPDSHVTHIFFPTSTSSSLLFFPSLPQHNAHFSRSYCLFHRVLNSAKRTNALFSTSASSAMLSKVVLSAAAGVQSRLRPTRFSSSTPGKILCTVLPKNLTDTQPSRRLLLAMLRLSLVLLSTFSSRLMTCLQCPRGPRLPWRPS
jgi:hypothetical protein